MTQKLPAVLYGLASLISAVVAWVVKTGLSLQIIDDNTLALGTVVTAILVALGTIVTVLVNLRTGSISTLQVIADDLRKELSQAQRENKELKEQVEKLSNELTQVKQKTNAIPRNVKKSRKRKSA
jgi:uncharacterized protein YlxW (UPF0749 family)